MVEQHQILGLLAAARYGPLPAGSSKAAQPCVIDTRPPSCRKAASSSALPCVAHQVPTWPTGATQLTVHHDADQPPPPQAAEQSVSGPPALGHDSGDEILVVDDTDDEEDATSDAALLSQPSQQGGGPAALAVGPGAEPGDRFVGLSDPDLAATIALVEKEAPR